jgi:hypothetical protein
MPLPLPSLDDRTWTDLTAEGVALIPRYAPNWTNQNASDPGITLVELLAWLTEMTIYRSNRIWPRHRRKFLELLGFDMQLPRAATTLLSFAPEASTAPFELPAGVQFTATPGNGLVVPFTTQRDLDVSPVMLQAIQVDAGDGNILDVTGRWEDQTPVAAFGTNPQPGAALYLGFNDLFSQIPIALGFRFDGPGHDAHERHRIIEEWEAQQASCIPPAPPANCDAAQSPALVADPDDVLPPYHSARLAWEVFTLAPSHWWKLQPVTAPARPYPGEVMDDTRSLTLDGIVEVNLPPALVPAVLGQVSTPLYYIRVRLDTGTWDAPPVLIDLAPNSVFAEQAAAAYATYPIGPGVTPGGGTPTIGAQIGFDLQLDVSETIQELNVYAPDLTARPDVIVLGYQAGSGSSKGQVILGIAFAGFGSGLPDQVFSLPSQPVQGESCSVYTLSNGVWQTWTLRKDFDSSTRTDFHAVLDFAGGVLTFGNGERGHVVPAGALVFCKYLATEADAGNVMAATVTRLADSPWNTMLLSGLLNSTRQELSQMTRNRGTAPGGAAAESLSHATGRAVETLFAHERLLELCQSKTVSTLDRVDHKSVLALKAPHRGVNLIDLERLALDVPGTSVARARAWSSLHPDYPCLEASGVVTITVLPNTPIAQPQPSAGLLQAISRFLNRRRIVCTRLEIVGPAYVVVTVQATVQTQANANLQRVQSGIVAALNVFLDPRTGGPDGLGWPFGRNVVRSEIMKIICGVQGANYVLSLSLSADSGTPQCGNLALCGMSLATPGNHQIEVS